MTKKDRKCVMTANLLKAFEAQFVYDTHKEKMSELISRMKNDYARYLEQLTFRELTLLHTSMTGSSTRFRFLGELTVKSFKNESGEFYSEVSHMSNYSKIHPFKSLPNPSTPSPIFQQVREQFFHKSFVNLCDFLVTYHEMIGLLSDAGYDIIESNTPSSLS